MSLTTGFARGAIVIVLMLLGSTRSSHAQGAWVGEAKSLDLDFAYHFVPASATVITPDEEVPDRPITKHIFTFGA
jgi:hypothetical protein